MDVIKDLEIQFLNRVAETSNKLSNLDIVQDH